MGIVLVSCAETGGAGGAPFSPSPVATAEESDASRSVSQAALRKKERPGLGTAWGREVNSATAYTTFRRASSKPSGGVNMIRYNDKEGARAMGVYSGYSRSGMQQAAGGLVEWGVKSGWGTLKSYHWEGSRFVIGNDGSPYSLVVKNRSRSRLEIVLSVDGLDVMDGKSASVKKRGYIVYPGKTLEVKGFRSGYDRVARFEFSSVSGSYANLRHGTTRNVGVIGMAVFTEKGVDPWLWSRREIDKRGSASPFAEAPTVRAR